MSLFFDPILFWMIATRLTGLIVVLPVVSDFPLPGAFKAWLVVWLSWFLVLQVEGGGSLEGGSLLAMVYGAVGELALGACLGMVVRFVFATIQIGGTLIDSELGLLAASQLNPNISLSGGVINRVFVLSAMFLFWILDFMPLIMYSLVESFSVIPPGSFYLGKAGVDYFISLGAAMFGNGVMLAVPVLALSFMTIFGLGMIAKAVQGINIMFESFSIKLAVGYLAVLTFFGLMMGNIRGELESILPRMAEFLVAVTPEVRS